MCKGKNSREFLDTKLKGPWEVIADSFNDKELVYKSVNELIPVAGLPDRIAELDYGTIDPNHHPFTRTALMLKTAFSEWRSQFSVVNENYTKSGQGNHGPHVFFRFCGGDLTHLYGWCLFTFIKPHLNFITDRMAPATVQREEGLGDEEDEDEEQVPDTFDQATPKKRSADVSGTGGGATDEAPGRVAKKVKKTAQERALELQTRSVTAAESFFQHAAASLGGGSQSGSDSSSTRIGSSPAPSTPSTVFDCRSSFDRTAQHANTLAEYRKRELDDRNEELSFRRAQRGKVIMEEISAATEALSKLQNMVGPMTELFSQQIVARIAKLLKMKGDGDEEEE